VGTSSSLGVVVTHDPLHANGHKKCAYNLEPRCFYSMLCVIIYIHMSSKTIYCSESCVLLFSYTLDMLARYASKVGSPGASTRLCVASAFTHVWGKTV